ncbi:MAG TPA: hypothetical protein VNN25_10280 [Thermoanaerobaculia bacterium]|nr:hypothetical protein [Thermoanaerobaculia bacterium]
MSPLRTFVLILVLSSGFASVASGQAVDASVCDVLANPASFDGKFIRIKGAPVVAGFDEFVIDGSGCKPSSAIWFAYPEGTKGKAGPAAFLSLQLAKNSPAVANATHRTAVTLQKNGDFKQFDSLLATQSKASGACLACPRYTVEATLVGRLDGVSAAGLLRDASGKVTGVAGFGNMNLYRARFVLQSVSSVIPHEVSDTTNAVAARRDSRNAGTSVDPEQAKRAIAAYGEPGEDNGVEVSFGIANEVSPDEGAKGKSASPDGILFRVRFDMNRIGKPMLSRAMAHMGTHIADVRGGVPLSGVDEAESRAWKVTVNE